MSGFVEVKISCIECRNDFMIFQYEPGATDGNVAGIDMNFSADGSVSMDMERLKVLRDACNAAIAANE